MSDVLARLSAALADRYRVEREVGAGGMATVYLALDLKHHRQVALKLLRPELAAALGAERFLREIEIAAGLRHPHILPLYDSGEADGFLYYVMPYVEGESLRDRLRREKQLPLDEALRIAREVADALSYAHNRGVVHRDIKPENILLESGHAVVADFGIARAITAAGGATLTQTGASVGTPVYMSPEQAAGERELDGRSDLYSLACVLYEMLAGQPPFTGPTVESLVHQHLAVEPPSITGLRPAVPTAIAGVLARALAKTPADRFSPVAQFSEALLTVSPAGAAMESGTGARAGATKPARAGSRRWLFLLGAVAGVAGVALLGSRLTRPGPPEVPLGRRVQATLASGLEVYPALSPNGDLFAYSAGSDYRLFVRQVDGGNPIPVAPNLEGIQGLPAWSPDGRQLAFTSARGLEVVPALGGTPRLLVPATSVVALPMAGGWSPDGREMAFVRRDTLYVTPAGGGGAPRVLTAGRELHSCAWSPDGRRIACVMGNSQAIMPGLVFGNLAPSAIVVVPAVGGPVVPVTEDGAANASPTWLPDGTLLYVSDREGGRDVYAVRLGRTGKASGAPQRLTTGLNAISVAASADGSRLAYAVFTETSNVWSLPVPARGQASVAQARQITRGNQVIENFDISADGEWLAFDSDRSGNSDLYRLRLAGDGDPEQITRTPGNEFWPRWSPDGREIAFHSFREGHRQIYLMPAAGGPATLVVRSEDDDRTPQWSPDGRRLFFGRNQLRPAAETQVVARAADGSWSAPAPWSVAGCFPVFSPDGRRAACNEVTGGGRLMLTDAGGDFIRVLAAPRPSEFVQDAGWSSDGQTVYYLLADQVNAAAYAVSAVAGAPRVVLRFDDPARPWHRYGFRVFRDRFYFTVGDRQSDVWVVEVGEGRGRGRAEKDRG